MVYAIHRIGKPGCLCCLLIYLLFATIPARASDPVQNDASLLSNNSSQIEATMKNYPRTNNFWDLRGWKREKKLVALNIASIGAVAAIGLSQWDYGTNQFRFTSEGWFGHNTDYGGSDKLEHAWVSYALTSAYSSIYQEWGYSEKSALLRGAASSAAVMTLVEIGDAFSTRYGFGWEDMVMNLAGIGAAYLRHTYPGLEKKIDFRIELRPWESRDHNKIPDSSGERFLLAFKLGGFINNPVLRAIDIQVGYYTKGYASREDERHFGGKHRYAYAGIGLNVTYLLEKLTGYRAAGLFDYIQMPGTSIETRN